MDAQQRAERMGARAAEQFARIDTDDDGMISPDEYEAAMQARAERMAEAREKRGERRQTRRERRMEVPQEMREMRARMRELIRDGMDLESFSGLAREQATARFGALDADGNGALSTEEFMASVTERAERMFARMDRDEDGRVTRDDRRRKGDR